MRATPDDDEPKTLDQDAREQDNAPNHLGDTQVYDPDAQDPDAEEEDPFFAEVAEIIAGKGRTKG